MKKLFELDMKAKEIILLIEKSREDCLNSIEDQMALINKEILELSSRPLEELRSRNDQMVEKYINLKESNAVI